MAKNSPPPCFPSIRDNFAAYLAFQKEPKTLASHQIVLHAKGNAGFAGQLEVVTMLLTGGCTWVAAQSANSKMSYRFAIRAPAYGKEPCFRFDSSGPSHRNDIGTLIEQKIETPHFHAVFEDGILRAYKTSELADPVRSVAIANNPQLGTEHFCETLNLVPPTGANVAYRVFPTELELEKVPLLGDANFPISP
jgi:hypothetical protein